MDILSKPAEAPRADPHAGCCGGWGLNTPGYPIRAHLSTLNLHETTPDISPTLDFHLGPSHGFVMQRP
jgi:hypothetical protein